MGIRKWMKRLYFLWGHCVTHCLSDRGSSECGWRSSWCSTKNTNTLSCFMFGHKLFQIYSHILNCCLTQIWHLKFELGFYFQRNQLKRTSFSSASQTFFPSWWWLLHQRALYTGSIFSLQHVASVTGMTEWSCLIMWWEELCMFGSYEITTNTILWVINFYYTINNFDKFEILKLLANTATQRRQFAKLNYLSS